MTVKEWIPREIADTPKAIEATVEKTRRAAKRAAAALREEKFLRRLYIIGNGSSLYTSMAAVYTARALARETDPLVMAVPAGEFRYYMPRLNEQDAVVGMSASGEFRDVLEVFKQLRGRCHLVGITHVGTSSLARLSDYLLVAGGGVSRVPVMTKTYASTLTALHLLLLELFSAPEKLFEDLAASATRCRGALEEAENVLPMIVPVMSTYDHAFYFGGGNAYPASLEGALKMKEMALLHAEGSETWEMASGPATVVSDQSFCVALYTGDPGDASTKLTAGQTRNWGARLLDIGPTEGNGDFHIRTQAAGLSSFSSLSLVPPLALLAYQVARSRGQNPNQPSWRERYHSQGMTHILGQ